MDVDAGRLWAGGLATALVAALIGVAGVVVARGVFDVPVLAPDAEGAVDPASSLRLAVFGAICALVATGLCHLLLMTTPRPLTFFTWIVALATVVAALLPWAATDNTPEEKIASSFIFLLMGLAIGSLLNGVAHMAVHEADDERY
jgi:uncharacterized membrane protein